MSKDENLEQKKKSAILSVFQLFQDDYNKLLDAVILMATVAKTKTSIELIGITAIMNENEPQPDPETPPTPGTPINDPDPRAGGGINGLG